MKEIFLKLLQHAQSTEWSTRHAAEDQYCIYCNNDCWGGSQNKHNDGCEYVKMIKEANQIAKDLK